MKHPLDNITPFEQKRGMSPCTAAPMAPSITLKARRKRPNKTPKSPHARSYRLRDPPSGGSCMLYTRDRGSKQKRMCMYACNKSAGPSAALAQQSNQRDNKKSPLSTDKIKAYQKPLATLVQRQRCERAFQFSSSHVHHEIG